MTEEKEVQIKFLTLGWVFTDPQTNVRVKVNGKIFDGSIVATYSDIGAARRIYHAQKKQGEQVAFLERKRTIIEKVEGKTAKEIKEYILAKIKLSGHKDFKILEGP